MYRSILQLLMFQTDLRLELWLPPSSNQHLSISTAKRYDAAGKALTDQLHARGRLLHEVA